MVIKITNGIEIIIYKGRKYASIREFIDTLREAKGNA